MKHIIGFTFFLLLSFSSYSQIIFEPGYFIDNSGTKVTCFIKNVDWKNNPSSFEYKLDLTSDSKEGNLFDIAEFSIENGKKYIRSKTKIDRSKSLLKNLSKSQKPELNEETLFLEIIIHGEANLYYYEDSNLFRFFFNKKDFPIQQLIYKKYLTQDNKIGKNTSYQKQLWDELKCGSTTIDDIKFTDYKKSELVEYFNNYNRCIDPNYISPKSKKSKNKDLTNIGFRFGMNSASVDFTSPQSSSNFNIKNYTSLKFGLELEHILPFNKNKWSIYIQPMYQSFEGEQELDFENVSISYKSIETSFGLRHYFFLNSNSKIFINTAFQIDTAFDSKIDYQLRNDYKIEPRSSFSFGLGYAFKNTYSLRLNYVPTRSLLGNYALIQSKYDALSIVFGYDFL